MKSFTFILFISIFFLAACGNCRWIEVDCPDYYDEDCDCGYWDCDESPVSYEEVYRPLLSIRFYQERQYSSDKNHYRCSLVIHNDGNAAARNIRCDITVKGDDIPGIIYGKTFHFEKDCDVIESYDSKEFYFGFSDVAYIGCCMHHATIKVTYIDNKGNKGNITEYYEL